MAIQVRAKQVGFYEARRRVGEVFTIRDEQAFSSRWMSRVEAKAEPKKDAKAEAKAGDGDQPPPKGKG